MVVHHEVIIGNNCNINHRVIIGDAYGGKSPGVSAIWHNVYIGPGAKIIGGIIVGNNVEIGANCVITKLLPDNALVVDVPGEIRSLKVQLTTG